MGQRYRTRVRSHSRPRRGDCAPEPGWLDGLWEMVFLGIAMMAGFALLEFLVNLFWGAVIVIALAALVVGRP